MKKAKIILTCVALLAIVGGALAFKAKKFALGVQAYSLTTVTSSTVGGNIYTATGSFCITVPGSFINTVNNLGVITDTWSTTTPLTTATFTSGALTITRAFPSCSTILQTRVTAVQ